MPRIRTAHRFNERQRTGDVVTDELVDFKSLLLSSDVLKGLNSTGFERPSPIQLKAIPLGRCGLDLIAQAKSGTGKTCVFSVIALESVLPDSNTTQVLILAPTREIAVQIKDVVTAIGSQMESMVCQVFIGGLPVDENKKMLKKPCHIAVGTPGRIKYLIENHFLKTESVRLFILDEADKLLEDNFQEQINWIFSSLPSNKQIMAFSATYPEYLANHLTRYMREPTFVRLNATDPTLQGIKQFHQLVPFHPLPHKTFQEKVSELLKLLSSLPFHQCLVFSNYQIRAQSLCDTLRLKGWPSVFIAGSQTQTQRLKAMERLKLFKCRVLSSTDLTSRGIDAENVNLVVNMDVPRDSETYLHRIGRAGRFGTQGVAVTFVAKGEEEKLFKRIEENIGTTIDVLPDPIPQSLCTSGTFTKLDSVKLQPKAASVEVDILKSGSRRESNGNVNQNNQDSMRNSEEVNDGGEVVCIGDQRSGTADLAEGELQKTDFKILSNQLPQQEKQTEGNKVLLKTADSEMEEIVANIQEKLQTSLNLDQSCEEENINGKEALQNAHRNHDVTLCQRNETDITAATNFQVTNELKTDHQPSFPFAPSEENSSVDKDILSSILQAGSYSQSRYSHKKAMDGQKQASGGKDWSGQNSKDEAVDHKLAKSCADEVNSDGSQSEEESTFGSISESEESSDDLEFDGHGTTERESGTTHFLPSVEEFEKDFEEYLENVSNIQGNFIENLPHSGGLSDDSEHDSIHPENILRCLNIEDGDGTPTQACLVSQRHNTLLDTYYQVSHQDSSSAYYNGQWIEVQNQTDDSIWDSHYRENNFSEGSQNNHHPCTAFCNGCYWSNNNYYDNHNQGYNNSFLPYHGNYGANWPANTQRQGDSTSSQQYMGQFYGSEEYQWNASWYNAYQRQTRCIRQFASFSRSARL